MRPSHPAPYAREERPGRLERISRNAPHPLRWRFSRVDGKPIVLPGEHVGGGSDIEQASEPEPADHAAPQNYAMTLTACHATSLEIPADPTRVLESVEIRATCSQGILGVVGLTLQTNEN